MRTNRLTPQHGGQTTRPVVHTHGFSKPNPSSKGKQSQNRYRRIVSLAGGREHQSLIKSAMIGVASAAALTGAAVLLMRDRPKDEQTGATSGFGFGSGFGFRRSAAAEVAHIEARRAKEAAEELAKWDTRYVLRNKKTLGELRQLAAQHRIRGRTQMRKADLIAALEVKYFGLEPNRAF